MSSSMSHSQPSAGEGRGKQELPAPSYSPYSPALASQCLSCWILRPWWSIWDHTAGGKGRDWPRVRSDPGLADHRPASCPPHSQAGKRRPRKSCIVQPFRACFPVWSGWQAAMLLAQCGITSWPSSQSRLVLKVKYTECRSLHPSNLARAHFPCIPSSCCL